MSELPPEIAVEHEPTDSDPPVDAVRTDRPRIWPEEPRPPRPQIKRPMEDWLAEFEERVKQQPAGGRDQVTRRRRPRGLARIAPVVQPQRAERPSPSGAPAQPGEQRRGRRRRRGSGRGQGQPQTSGAQPQPSRSPRTPEGQPQRPPRKGNRPPRTNAPSGQSEAGRPPRVDGDGADAMRRRRRRGRGRGRGGRGPQSPPGAGGGPGGGGGPPST
jgi:translation initiation factor IF-2